MGFIHEDRFEVQDIEAITTGGGRRYKVPNGELYESVTTALVRQPEKIRALAKWRRRVGEAEANRITRLTSNRGTRMHTMCEHYLNNDEDYIRNAMPTTIELFRTIQPILDKAITKVYMQEAPLWSHKYRLAGRVDCVADIKGKLSVIDYKTSSKTKKREWVKDYFRQTAAYSHMIEEMYGDTVDQTVIFIAVVDRDPQIFVGDPHTDIQDTFFQERLHEENI